jgi:hypothetical protein
MEMLLLMLSRREVGAVLAAVAGASARSLAAILLSGDTASFGITLYRTRALPLLPYRCIIVCGIILISKIISAY